MAEADGDDALRAFGFERCSQTDSLTDACFYFPAATFTPSANAQRHQQANGNGKQKGRGRVVGKGKADNKHKRGGRSSKTRRSKKKSRMASRRDLGGFIIKGDPNQEGYGLEPITRVEARYKAYKQCMDR